MMKFTTAFAVSMKEFAAKITSPITRTYNRVRSDEFKTTMKNNVRSGYRKFIELSKSFLSKFKVQAMKTSADVIGTVLPIMTWILRILVIAVIASFAVTLLKPFSGMALRALLGVGVSHIVLSILNDTFKKMTATPEEEVLATVSEAEEE